MTANGRSARADDVVKLFLTSPLLWERVVAAWRRDG